MENSKNKALELYNLDELINYSIKEHLSFINKWINNADIISRVEEIDILTHTVSPILLLNNEEINEDTLLRDSANYFILGGPGTGKTILIKRLIQKVLNDPERSKYGLPVLVRARELADNSLINEIKKILGVIHLETNEAFKLIVENRIIIFIDGLDELTSEGEQRVISELSELYQYSDKSRVISTSRQYIRLPKCKYCQIRPFNTKQLIELLGLELPEKDIYNFLNQMQSLGIQATPLLIRIAFLIFQELGQLPHKKVQFYKYWIDLSISQWDKVRMVKRKSKFSTFDPSQKYFILTFTAFDLSVNHQSFSFSHNQFLSSISKIQTRLELNTEDFDAILDELIINTGLIIQTESSFYQFVHRGIQEYLAAEYLVKLPYAPYNDLLKRAPSILALCILISSDPIFYYSIVLDSIINENNESSIYDFLLLLFSQAERHEIESFYNVTNREITENNLSPKFIDLIKTAYNIGIANSGA